MSNELTTIKEGAVTFESVTKFCQGVYGQCVRLVLGAGEAYGREGPRGSRPQCAALALPAWLLIVTEARSRPNRVGRLVFLFSLSCISLFRTSHRWN
jgi:hypothetical protein